MSDLEQLVSYGFLRRWTALPEKPSLSQCRTTRNVSQGQIKPRSNAGYRAGRGFKS